LDWKTPSRLTGAGWSVFDPEGELAPSFLSNFIIIYPLLGTRKFFILKSIYSYGL